MKLRIPDIDKQGHVWAGWALLLTWTLVFGNLVSGVFAATGAAVLREAFGNRDLGDFLATALGICVGVLVWWGATT